MAPSKCRYMIFTQNKIIPKLNIFLQGEQIIYTNHMKFLGLTFECRLNFKAHINEIKTRSILGEYEDKLGLSQVSDRLDDLNERFQRNCLANSNVLVARLLDEYRRGFESRYIERATLITPYYLKRIDFYLYYLIIYLLFSPLIFLLFFLILL